MPLGFSHLIKEIFSQCKKKGRGVKKKGGGGWGPPINPKKTIKLHKFMNEITLKMNGRNPKRPITGAPVIKDGRTNGLTNIIFFLPFPKTKPLVPRGNYINLFHLCMCVSVFVGEGRGGEGGGT